MNTPPSPRLSIARRWRSYDPPTSWDLVMIVAGCLVVALAFRLFTNANGIVAGGLVGLSTLLQGAFGWEPAMTQWVINVPLLVAGFFILGRAEGMRTVVGSVALPFWVWATRGLHPVTHTPLLAALFGGMVYGGGLAMVLGARGSVGGYSLIGRVVQKQFGVSVPTVIFTLDALTILGSVWTFGPEGAMYGLIGAFMMRRSTDQALLGFSRTVMALVISERHATIRERVLTDLYRGLTVLPGEGGYSHESRPVLMIVLARAEVPRLRTLVKEEDPNAFVVITDAAEVVGEGFPRIVRTHSGTHPLSRKGLG